MFLMGAALLACTAIDGDTLRCGEERVRLIGIDAPELHGCPRRRICVPGDGNAAREALAVLVRKPVRLRRFGKDRYGRTLAIAYAGGRNVACAQLAGGNARYVAKWDARSILAGECQP